MNDISDTGVAEALHGMKSQVYAAKMVFQMLSASDLAAAGMPPEIVEAISLLPASMGDAMEDLDAAIQNGKSD